MKKSVLTVNQSLNKFSFSTSCIYLYSELMKIILDIAHFPYSTKTTTEHFP